MVWKAWLQQERLKTTEDVGRGRQLQKMKDDTSNWTGRNIQTVRNMFERVELGP